MKITTPDYYKEFACIGGTCIDTCCAGWEVDVDKKSSAYYKSVEGEFGDRLRRELVDYPIEDRFILKPDGRCPFLNDCNLCDIYTALGEQALCETCTNFPRHITEFGNTREIGISLSCPTAVELIMSKPDKITYSTEENEEKFSGYNDIDAQLYFMLGKSRQIAYDICQNRDLPVNHRAVLLLDFARELQKKVNKPKKISDVNSLFTDEEYMNNRLINLKRKYTKPAYKNKKGEYLLGILDTFDELEHIKAEWPPILEYTREYVKNGMPDYTDFNNLVTDREYEYEHLLVYYVFRYFLRAVFDGEVYKKVLLGIMAYIMQKSVGAAYNKQNDKFEFVDQITLMRIYSKETEHSEENLEYLYNAMSKNKNLKFSRVLTILLDLQELLIC